MRTHSLSLSLPSSLPYLDGACHFIMSPQAVMDLAEEA